MSIFTQKAVFKITKTVLGIVFLLLCLSPNVQAQEEAVCEFFHAEELCESIETCFWENETCKKGKDKIIEDLVVPLETPASNQIIQLTPAHEEWKPDKIQTFGIKFLIRGKEALTWALNIESTGFDNSAIKKSYLKVLTITNSLFILGLLAIAAMWMFSVVLPRHHIKKIIFIYAGAVIFVNFAFPLNRFLIDSTNLIQKTLLIKDGEKIGITDIVKTPLYDEAIIYEKKSDTIYKENTKKINIKLGESEDLEEEKTYTEIGNISAPDKPITGTLTGGRENQNLELNIMDQPVKVKTNQSITLSTESEFAPNKEQSIFRFTLIIATGLAYFILAMIFIIRVIILWALLILSPALLILAVFKSTRGWFYNWLSIYGRWLLIGPLTALGIMIIINIWQTTGMPIESSYKEGIFPDSSNISFYLPGETVPNSLKSTEEMMEYLIFLIMLYLPIFLAFALTRKKIIQNITGAVTGYIKSKTPKLPQKYIETETEKTSVMDRNAYPQTDKTEKISNQKIGVINNFTNFINSNISKITKTAMPQSEENKINIKNTSIPSASNFLPQQIKLTGTHKMLELIGMQAESRQSRSKTIEKLASYEKISDKKEKERVYTVRKEIQNRAELNDNEAILLMNEIHEKEKEDPNPPTI